MFTYRLQRHLSGGICGAVLLGFIALSNASLLAQDNSAPQPDQSQPRERITVEGIYTGKYREASMVAGFQWLADGNAVLYDVRQSAATRAFELLSPQTGKRRPFGDMAKLRAGMKTARGTDQMTMLTFNSTGTHGFVEFEGGIVLADIAKGEVTTIAQGAKEDCTRFSPDGTKIAFVRGNDLYVYDINSKVESRLTNDGSATVLNGTHSWVYWEEVFDREDAGYYWSPDSKALAYYQSDESPVSTITFPHFKPAVQENILQRYPKAGGVNPKVRLGVVELNANNAPSATKWVDFGEASFEYVVRVKWLPDSKRVSVQTLTRDQQELALYFADRATGKATRILKETNEGWVNVHDDLYFMKDGKSFIWASERTGFNHLYRYTMNGTLQNAITKGSWAVGEARGRAIAGVDEKNEWVYFKALEKSSVERHLYRIKFDGSKMQRLTEETGTHTITMNETATHYFDNYSSLTAPPSLSLHSADGKRLQVLSPSRPEAMAAYQLQFPTLLTIPTPDGFQMPAQILKPRDFDTKKRYPVIIYVYGGPSAPNVINAWQGDNYFYQILADAGYVVVKMDNRSAAAISKLYENTCLKQLAGDSELNDLLAGVRWLKQQAFVDSTRIGIWGWSFGGAFTLLAMTHSKEFKAGIAVAAPTDWRYYDTKYTEAFMKTPQDNPAGYEKTNLNAHAKNLHGRLYLVHGTYDDNVHPQNVWNFIDELVKAGKQFDLMIYPMRKHGISDAPARIHLYKSMVEFWKNHL